MRSASKANPGRRLCAVSVDLDEIPCYTAIHGLDGHRLGLSPEASQAIYRRALPRLAALFERLGIRATFFAVGRDVEQPHAAEALRALVAQGHEVGNHSYDHRYDLTRLSRAEMRAQVARGIEAIERAVGTVPTGFRAPGYTFTDALAETLQELGVVYDSSVFPCPAYYAPKLLAISLYRMLGRATRSIVDHPRVLTASADPYRIGSPYTRTGTERAVLELPVGVTRDVTGRLPFIGTSLILAGRAGAELLCQLIEGRELVNLLLHGIDAADAEQDGLTALRSAQWDLQRSADTKLATLEAALTHLRDAGYEFVTLAQSAAAFSTRAA
jgi:peptidoglycan/xylan/chitin deacetylase (PgdA/CDA1 family)